MELKEVIKNRHSCRAYLPTPISDNVIRDIIESARLAPSSKNAQQWKFVCIKTDKESKDIAQLLENYYIENKNKPDKMQGASSVFATGKILEQCPAIILVFEDSEWINRVRCEDISAMLSIGASVEHMMLTATDLGLGCLWICDTFFVHNELADYVLDKLKGTEYEKFINRNNRLVCAMALGEMGEPRYDVPRKSIEDILCIINN
ncbi:MAG: nitroreductase family protein [Clostridiales bacterium]|nr:nitroreductase family protein [Clostridiales bacterium]